MSKSKVLNLVIAILLLFNFSIWISEFQYLEINKDQNLEIKFLDVGQGDSILIKTPQNKYVLIDGGKGDKVLSELEKEIPINIFTLYLVIFTHPDADHIEGLNSVLKKYNVENVFIQKVDKDTNIYENSKEIIKSKGINNFQVTSTSDFYIDKVFFDVEWPNELQNLYQFEDVNNTSIGLTVEYKEFSMFLGGDLDSSIENLLVSSKDLEAVDILKAGHHGSKTSTSETFLKKLQPKITVISASKNNRYGHPHSEVIDRLKNIKSKIINTADFGTIRFETDGNTINLYNGNDIETFNAVN